MTITELIDYLQGHLIRYGDGDVTVETRSAVLDVTKADADKFEEASPWSVVLIVDEDSP